MKLMLQMTLFDPPDPQYQNTLHAWNKSKTFIFHRYHFKSTAVLVVIFFF